MPSQSLAQHRFMAVMMNNPDEARKHGIAPATAAEFVHADKGMVSKLPERKKHKPTARQLGEALMMRRP